MRGGANRGSIFDYQREHEGWIEPSGVPRDPGWRLLAATEAELPSGQEGEVGYSLDYYQGAPPYHWR